MNKVAIINFALSHIAPVIGGLVLDLVIAINPKIKANGVFHAIYLMVKKPSA